MVDAWNNAPFGEEAYQARYDKEQDEFWFCGGALEAWNGLSAQTIEIEGKIHQSLSNWGILLDME
jgi:hypothetical protein